MLSRLLALAALVFWLGAALMLSQVRWFRRSALAERLQPYAPGGMRGRPPARPVGPDLRRTVAPLVARWGHRLASAVGVQEDAAIRLARIHSPLDAGAFRLHQLGRVALGAAGGLVLATALRPPLSLAVLFVVGGPLLAFLIVEQGLAQASERRQRRIFLELPVVSEQMGMLLGAGYSLGGAIGRLAERGSGACAEDLALVSGRIRQGLSEIAALQEWSARADVEALGRLVAILALNREAGDLGRLAAEEARTIRRDVQRQVVEQIERRSQQVWVPVTVATLVPGAVLLAVPFIEALRLFSNA